MNHRQGVYLSLPRDTGDEQDTLTALHQLAATDSEEEGEEGGYTAVESSGDDSYHSDNDEIAEYWDPYRKRAVGRAHVYVGLRLAAVIRSLPAKKGCGIPRLGVLACECPV